MPRKFLGLLVGVLLFIVPASAGAATVDLQVEGIGANLALKSVNTPAGVTKNGDSCAGTTDLGALDVATAGNWDGTSYGPGFTVNSILGESHPFGSGGYWAVYINGRFQNGGPCENSVANGDHVLFFASDDPFTAGNGGYDEPVYLAAPKKVTVGQPFTVTASDATTSFNPNPPYEGTTTFSASAGAVVSDGATSVQTGASGTATFVRSQSGTFSLKVTQGNRAPVRVLSCATNGNDGQCLSPPCKTNGKDGFCGSPDKQAALARVSSIKHGQRFRKRGPRQLKGTIAEDASGLKGVRLRLTRRLGIGEASKPCRYWSAQKNRFVAQRCGAKHGKFFRIETRGEQWSYLLPSALPHGRYVLDVEVTDKAGNKTKTFNSGINRVVFYVK